MIVQVRTAWPSNCESHTYVTLFLLSGCPMWGALVGASEVSPLSLRFLDDKPGGSEAIKTTGFGRGR